MKKFYSVLLALILSFSLVACGDNGDNEDNDGDNTSEQTTVDNDTDVSDDNDDDDDDDDGIDIGDGNVNINEEDRVVDDIDGWSTEVGEEWLTFARGIFFGDETLLYDAISQTHTYAPSRMSIDEKFKTKIDAVSFNFIREVNRENEDNYRILFSETSEADGLRTISVAMQDMGDNSFEATEVEASNNWKFDFYIDENDQIFLEPQHLASLRISIPFESVIRLQDVELEATDEETRVHEGSVDEEITSQIYEINNLMEGRYTVELESNDIYSVVSPVVEYNVTSTGENSFSIGAFNGNDGRNFVSVRGEHLPKIQEELEKIYAAILLSLSQIVADGHDHTAETADLMDYQPEVEGIDPEVVETIFVEVLDETNLSNHRKFEMIDVPLPDLIQAASISDGRLLINYQTRMSSNVEGVNSQNLSTYYGTAIFEIVESGGEYSFKLVGISHTI